jgi:nucleoside 2-deoxyribosyltransferase
MLIYLSAPLFCQAELAFNAQLTEKLEERGFDVFLPQRDGAEGSRPPYDRLEPEALRQAIFSLDRDKVLEADILLFVLDGRVPDEGACVELGIAYGQKYVQQRDKLLIGLHTDMRAAFPGAKLNAMIAYALDHVVEDEESLMAALEAYRDTGP